MKRIHAAAGMVNQTPLDWAGNSERLRSAIAEARARGVQLLCLPELAVTGYGCEDAFLSPGVAARAMDELLDLAHETEGMVAAVGLPVFHRGALFNCAAVLCDGELVGFVAKQNLAGDGLHYEPRWFKAWPNDVADEIEVEGGRYPFGDWLFDVGGVRLGFEIGEDAWVADRPGPDLARRGVDIILNPSGSHFAFGKQEVRERFVVEGSRAFACSYVYTNLIGNDAGRVIYDGGAMLASGGRLLAEGPRFSFRDFELVDAVIDVGHTRMLQTRSAAHRVILGDREEAVAELGFEWDPGAGATPVARGRKMDKPEEFARAVALGLFDYLRKSRSRGYVISLSGGADSSSAACLVRIAIDLALAELGADGVREKLGHLDLPDGVDGWAGALLTCVYQATRNSSDTTREAARAVAEGVGATFLEWDIDALVEGYKATVGAALGREWSWEGDDLTLQNIQARARGPGVWMVANAEGKLLLATSNRSEAAVGYTTMDGDTCGGLSPVGGIDKAFLRDWLRWLEAVDADWVAAVPALAKVNAQQPTAELRPGGEGQTDEGDLMPFPVLDAIERMAIRDKRLPGEVLLLLGEAFPERELAQLRVWVVKFFRLWSRNQWKRERYAPSFHLDDENLDPKTWCRFPILSGGFAEELAELEGEAR